MFCGGRENPAPRLSICSAAVATGIPLQAARPIRGLHAWPAAAATSPASPIGTCSPWRQARCGERRLWLHPILAVLLGLIPWMRGLRIPSGQAALLAIVSGAPDKAKTRCLRHHAVALAGTTAHQSAFAAVGISKIAVRVEAPVRRVMLQLPPGLPPQAE